MSANRSPETGQPATVGNVRDLVPLASDKANRTRSRGLRPDRVACDRVEGFALVQPANAVGGPSVQAPVETAPVHGNSSARR